MCVGVNPLQRQANWTSVDIHLYARDARTGNSFRVYIFFLPSFPTPPLHAILWLLSVRNSPVCCHKVQADMAADAAVDMAVDHAQLRTCLLEHGERARIDRTKEDGAEIPTAVGLWNSDCTRVPSPVFFPPAHRRIGGYPPVQLRIGFQITSLTDVQLLSTTADSRLGSRFDGFQAAPLLPLPLLPLPLLPVFPSATAAAVAGAVGTADAIYRKGRSLVVTAHTPIDYIRPGPVDHGQD